MENKTNLIKLFILINLLNFSCNFYDSSCFHSSGKLEEKVFILDTFECITINGFFEVYWHNSSDYQVKIRDGKNNLKFFEIKVENKTLIINDKNKCKYLREYKKPVIDIYCPYLRKVNLYSSNNFYCVDTIIVNDFLMNNYDYVSYVELKVKTNVFCYSLHAGTGDTYVCGYAENSYIWVNGNAYFWGENFKTKNSEVTHKSTGDIIICVTNKLLANIYKVGNLIIYGNPLEISVSLFNRGKLILK